MSGSLGAGAHSRRSFLRSAAVAAGAAWLPAFRVDRASAAPGCVIPPGFPQSIDLYQQAYENWAGAIKIDALWTCAPRNAAEVAKVVNWAHAHRYRIRPRGAMHGWAPLAVTSKTGCDDRVVMVDTTQHLTGMHLVDAGGSAVRAQAGASMESILTFLEGHGLGFATATSTGPLTIGGVLAIGGHGACLSADGERIREGHTHGTFSNLVIEIEAIVWSHRRGRYVVRRFSRSHPDAHVLLTHLGRAFVTEVTLRAATNQHLRCESFTDIPASELFASPGAGGQTFESFVRATGRCEAIWFPFTTNPWLKVWSVRNQKPAGSRETTSPYNYTFTDNYPASLVNLAQSVVSSNPAAAPLFGAAEYEVSDAGLTAGNARDLWGRAKNVLFYIRPTTLRFDEFGWAILTHRRNIQRVVSDFTGFYEQAIEAHKNRGEYPANGPFEVRCSGIDRPAEAGVHRARVPSLSSLAPPSSGHGFDACVWLNVLTLKDTPGQFPFYRELERFILHRFRGSYATVRPEWSKGWAATPDSLWSDHHVLRHVLPRRLSAHRPAHSSWHHARKTLNRYDPHRVFSNHLLDRLLP